MLQNAYLLAKIGADTAENERNFAETCQKLATTLRVHYRRRAVQGGLRGGRAGEGPPGVRDRQRPRPQLHELRSFITQNVETSRLNFELPLTEILNELLFKTQNMSAEPRFAEFLQNFEFSAKFSKIS